MVAHDDFKIIFMFFLTREPQTRLPAPARPGPLWAGEAQLMLGRPPFGIGSLRNPCCHQMQRLWSKSLHLEWSYHSSGLRVSIDQNWCWN